MKNKIFGFKYRYPQSFLDDLAKKLGFEWTKVKFKTIPKEEIEIKPLDLPSGELYYLDIKYKGKL